MNNNSFEEIWNKLKECKKVLMSLHTGPDGDSLGSCTAMKYMLEKEFGAEVTLVSYDPLSEDLATLPIAKEVIFGKDILDYDLKEFDVLVCLDSGAPDRIGKQKEREYVFPKEIFSINIDHHAANTHYATMNLVVADDPSTCSTLLKGFEELGVTLDAEVSKRLLVGICTDTGFFKYDMPMKEIFREVMALLDHGADYVEDVLRPLAFQGSLRVKKYHGLLLSNLKVDLEKKLGYSTASEDELNKLDLNLAEVRSGVSAINNIKGIDFIFTLAEFEGTIKGSFRTTNRVDVSRFAKALGGGGHKAAAGFILENMDIATAEKKVLDVIEELGVERFTR